jgi:hypothetical protein
VQSSVRMNFRTQPALQSRRHPPQAVLPTGVFMQDNHRRPPRAANKTVWGLILMLFAALGLYALVPASIAQATGSNGSSASCDGVHATASGYSLADENLFEVYLDGGLVDIGSFGESLDKTYPVPQDTSSHTWSVVVDSTDNSGDATASGSVGPCDDPPPPPDQDGDGVPDDEDDCDNEPGPASNNGCPETQNDNPCAALDTGHLSANDDTTFTYTAAPGEVIVGFCVKAGSANQGDGPEYCPGEDWCPSLPATSITFSHSSGKEISHFSVDLEKVTPPPPVCPPDTDHAGTPISDLDDNNGDGDVDSDDCDEIPPPPPPKCPPGTDHEGDKVRDLDDNNGDGDVDSDDCNEPEPPKQCPDGSTVPADKECPKPVCPNLPGEVHYKVPDGMVMNQDGDCGVPTPPTQPGNPTPPTPPVVEHPVYGMVPSVPPSEEMVPVTPNTAGENDSKQRAILGGLAAAGCLAAFGIRRWRLMRA